MSDLIARPHAYRASLDPMDQGDCAICGHSHAAHADAEAERALLEAQSCLWRVPPNTHTVPCPFNGYAVPDPFEGPGETWEATARRESARAERLEAALSDLLASVAGIHGSKPQPQAALARAIATARAALKTATLRQTAGT